MIDFFYGFCINDTDLQEITKTEVGITKTEVADFWLLYKYEPSKYFPFFSDYFQIWQFPQLSLIFSFFPQFFTIFFFGGGGRGTLSSLPCAG